MKILVIAPESSDLKILPEISGITSMHHVQIISGYVTSRRIYDAAVIETFDVVHFASHGSVAGILLSDGDVLSAEQVSAICRLAKARLLFLNSCNMGKVAAYATRHGVDFAIFAIEDIVDEGAWTIPIAFYRSALDHSDLSLLTAILIADSGEAVYGYAVNPEVLIHYIKEIAEIARRIEKLESQSLPEGNINHNRLAWGILLYLVVVTIVVLAIFAGRM